MATWKKVIVSGSDISQLNNDSGFIASVGGGIISSSAEGSTQGTLALNGVDVDVNGMQAADSPTFVAVTANLTGNVTGNVTGTADTASYVAGANVDGVVATATALASGQNFSATGDVTAPAVSFDGTGAVALAMSISTDAVTSGSIADGNVTSAKIAADSITVAQLSGSAVITAAEGIGSNDVDTAVPTAAAVKAYADSVVGASDLDFAGDSGTGAVDLDSQTFTVAGGDGLTSAATGQTVTLVISESGVTNDMLEGSIGNDKLSNSSITIGDQSTSLGGTITAFSGSFTGDGSALTGVTADTLPNSITDGNGIADFTFNGSSAASVAVQIDGSTLAVSSTGVKVADAGVTETQIATSVAGTGLSGGAGTALSVDYGSLANTAAQGNVTIEVAGTTNEIEITGGGSAALGTSRTITVGLPDDVTITGDLTVLGTASFQDTQNLAIADRFILLASGSNTAGDGGIVVQQTTQDIGDVFAYENSVTRWGIGTAFNASDNSYTPDAFMAAVINTAGNDPNDVDAPDARYEKKGNLYVASNSEDIWIYS
tara:strand:+ start:1761 stop:3395 length:1635 start_codon:yes stop_codon:yes gene_type:complete